MKSKLIIAMLALAVVVRAQILHVDTTTLTTNTTTSSAKITVFGQFTNANYTVINTNNRVTGDSFPDAFAKINGDFDWVETQIASNSAAISILQTNGGGGSIQASNIVGSVTAQISGDIGSTTNFYGTNLNSAGSSPGQILTATSTGTTWSNAPAGGGSGGTNLTPWISDINAAGHSLTNAGTLSATNISVSGDTLLNNSNLHVFSIQNGTAGSTNALIPLMTSSNTPSGMAIASSGDGYLAFNAPTGYVWQSDGSTSENWLEYTFDQSLDVSKTVYFLVEYALSTNTTTFQGSQDGIVWVDLCTNNFTAYQYGSMTTNSFQTYRGRYFRWHSVVIVPQIIQMSYVQIYGVGGILNVIDSTNGLRVAGNVDSTVGFTVNGIPIGGSGAIPNLNGSGTNTTIGFFQTNTFSTLITLIGTNFVVNGTNYYYYDGDTTSGAYTNFPYYSGRPPVQVWTNSDSSNPYEITAHSQYEGTNALNYYAVVTNGGAQDFFYNTKPYYLNSRPDGQYWSLNGAANPPVGVSIPSSTSIYFTTTISNGQFTPMTVQFALDATTLVYVLNHGLGHTPHMIEWSLLCIYPDSNLGTVLGDVIKPISSSYCTFFSSPTELRLSSNTYFVGNEGTWIWPSKNGPYAVHPSSFTNFVLQVEFYP
jgi:hypothetical protein